MSTLVTNCPTKCPPVDKMDWQKSYGIVKASQASNLILAQIIAGGGAAFADFIIPKNSFLIGYIVNDNPIGAGSVAILQPANGTVITANFDKSLPNCVLDNEAIYIKLRSGAAEEKVMAQILSMAWCTTDFICNAHTVRVTNLALTSKTVQPVIVDFQNWILPS